MSSSTGVATVPSIRSITLHDLRDVMDLLHREGWYDRTAHEIEMLLSHAQPSCFKIVLGRRLVGLLLSHITPTSICYYAGLLIDSAYRGTLDVLDGVLKFEQLLEARSTIRIGYADKRILPFYLDYGYEALETYSRYALRPHAVPTSRWEVRPLGDFDLAEVYMLNEQVLRDTRAQMLQHFSGVPAARAVVARDPSGVLGGYALSRRTSIGTIVGPCVSERDGAAAALVSSLTAEIGTDETLLLVGEVGRTDAWLRQSGIPFTRQETLATKVYKGDAGRLEDTSRLFGIFGFGLT